MAQPKEFYKEEIPKPSGYLHYWYANSDAKSNINALLHQSAQALLIPQLSQYRAKIFNLQNSLSAGIPASDRETLLQLFDISMYDKEALQEILAPTLEDDPTEEAMFTPKDLKDAQNKLSEIRRSTDGINKKFPQFRETVEELVNMFDPSGKNRGALKAIQDDLWNSWKAQAVANKYISGAAAAEKEQTQVAKAIIRNILDKANGDQVFSSMIGPTPQIGTTEVTTAVTKMLLLAKSLETLGNAGKTNFGMRNVELRHGNQTNAKKTMNNGNEILTELIGKVFGFISNTKGQVAEDAFVYGYLNSHVKNKATFQKLKVKEKVLGRSQVKVTTKVDDNKSLLRILDELEKDLSNYEKQTSKADGAIQISGDHVSGNIGFSIKTGDKLNIPGYEGSADITLQSGTSLMMLLAREMHLSTKQYHDVLQLLVGHGGGDGGDSDSELDRKWEALKNQLVQLAFVDALTGSTDDGKAHFMVIGGNLYSMERIILDMLYGNNLSLGMSQLLDSKTKQLSGSLLRSDYMSLNNWEGGESSSYVNAMLRSDKLWRDAGDLLFQTKINISMNISSMKAFRNLAGK